LSSVGRVGTDHNYETCDKQEQHELEEIGYAHLDILFLNIRNTRIDLREKIGQLNADHGAEAEHEMANS
jgi:hypothetical protein